MMRIDIPQAIAEDCVEKIKAYADVDVAIAIIVIPAGIKDAQPSFLTNMDPPSFEQLMRAFSQSFADPVFLDSRIDVPPESKH